MLPKKGDFSEASKAILSELETVLSTVDETQVQDFIRCITQSNRIVVCGAGRVGMSTRAFGMRLAHLGFKAYTLGDSNVPGIGEGDLFIVSSGSGETQTIYDLVLLAKKTKVKIVLITGNKDSRMGKEADHIVEIKAPSKVKAVAGFTSIQPMTTLNEQSLLLFFDSVVLLLMATLKLTHDDMWALHSNLE